MQAKRLSCSSKLSVAIRRSLLLTLLVNSSVAWSDASVPADTKPQDTASASSAQSSDQAAKDSAGKKDDTQKKPTLLGEVKVVGYHASAATSATGVVTDLIDTPISISTITSQFLKDTGSSQIMDAIGSLPGVTGQSNSGEVLTDFSVRGYPVAPQIDGFDSLGIASGLGSSVGVDRIEVLKGPSAVFNGNVPPGGSINIIYKKPSFTPTTYVQGEVGSYEYGSGEFFSTGPATDKLAYLVDAYYKNADGYVDWTKQDERTLILGLTYKPIDSLSINVNYRNINNQNQVSTLPVSHPGFIGSGLNQYTYLDDYVAQTFGPNEPPQTITVPQYLPGGVRYNVLGPQNYNDQRNDFWSTELNWKVNDHVQIRDDFAYSHFTWNLLALLQSGAKVLGPDGNAGLVSGFLKADQAGTGWENKLETAIDFETGFLSHELLIGAQYSMSRSDYLNGWIGGPQIDANGQPWNFFTDGPLLLQNEYNARYAANPMPDIHSGESGITHTHAYYFAEQMSAFDDRLRALIGARFTKTVSSGAAVSDTTPQIGLLAKPFSPDSAFGQTSFYLNYSKSFTPSGLTEPGSTQVVPPAKGTGKEFGFKTEWLDGKLTSTVSFFRDDLANIATPDYSHQGMNGELVLYNLGGIGRTQGSEAEVNWTPSKSLQLSVNFTDLAVAKYLAYPGVPQEIGLRFPSTPRQAGNLTGKYTIQEGPLGGLYFGGWLHAQTSTRGVLASDWHYDVRIPGLMQVSAFVGYAIGQFDFRLNVDNLTNRAGYVMNNAFQPQTPRSAYLTVKYTL